LTVLKRDNPSHPGLIHSKSASYNCWRSFRSGNIDSIFHLKEHTVHWPHGPLVLHGELNEIFMSLLFKFKSGSGSNDSTIMVEDQGLIFRNHLNLIPYTMKGILNCSGLTAGAEHLWWRWRL
jgi:hypothetical protein